MCWFKKKQRYIECEISTPQHKNGKVSYYHRQKGVFDTFSNLFVPKEKCCGNHEVKFDSIQDFLKYKL